MKKGYLVGGLAIVGAIALLMYLKPKPKRNSDGFFNAGGTSKMSPSRGRCAYCRTNDGDVYHTGSDRNCESGDICITKYSY